MLKDILDSLLSEDRKAESVESQLGRLGRFGIRPNPGVRPDDLFVNFSREELEEEPFTLLLPVLGGSREVSEGVYEPIADGILYLDGECIENADVYLEILNRLQTMTGGILTLENASAATDEDAGTITVAFHFNGKECSWLLGASGAEIDVRFFSAYNALLREAGADKRIQISVSSESLLVIYLDKKSDKELNKLALTGFYEP